MQATDLPSYRSEQKFVFRFLVKSVSDPRQPYRFHNQLYVCRKLNAGFANADKNLDISKLRRRERKSDNRISSIVALRRKEATRTPDPYVPNVVRYQLRYFPIPCCKIFA